MKRSGIDRYRTHGSGARRLADQIGTGKRAVIDPPLCVDDSQAALPAGANL